MRHLFECISVEECTELGKKKVMSGLLIKTLFHIEVEK